MITSRNPDHLLGFQSHRDPNSDFEKKKSWELRKILQILTGITTLLNLENSHSV